MTSMAASSHSKQAKERPDVQAAIAKAVELRSLHAALLQRSGLGSPAVLGPHVGASPSFPRRSAPPSVAAEDYPVFTPSHEEPSKSYNHVHPEHCSLPATWRSIKFAGDGIDAFPSGGERSKCAKPEHFSKQSSSISHNSLLQSSLLSADALRFSSSRTSPGDYESFTTCNSCKPATISRRSESEHRSLKLTRPASSPSRLGSEEALHTARAKHRGPILSWLFRTAKKKKNELEMNSNAVKSEEMSQFLTDWGLLSLESAKRELLEANRARDAAVTEVSEMRASFGEMQQKLASLEAYCEELNKALKQAKSSQVSDRLNLSKRPRVNVCMKDNLQVSQAAMVEGFLQMVSESRLSVRQFCSMLIHQMEASDCGLREKLDLLLRHQCDGRQPKAVVHHVEALVNETLFQDFENCAFQKNGAPRCLDQEQERRESLAAFMALRSLSWNQVLRKGTKYFSEDFSRFCDQKMSCVVSLLACTRMWPERLLQCFFVAAKCVWLLHLLAFSFSPPLAILRVEEDRKFDPLYMEEIILEKKKAEEAPPAQVKLMVMPGFYIHDASVLKCRVLCRYLD